MATFSEKKDKKPKNLDLLMIGKTGNGKSALGNMILGRKAFISKCSTASVTTNIQYEVSEVNGRIIKIVDGPGVGDTRMNTEAATKLVMDKMTVAISANPQGFHAFLLVVKFGGRFTEEDKDTIVFLKKIFGETFLKDYCILVLTCGDNFQKESEESGITFEEWCDEQGGIFKELLEECCWRVVLFDNKTGSETVKRTQLKSLFKMVDRLTFHGHRYKDENFNKALAARERLMIESKKPMIREETMTETSLIIQSLQRVQQIDEPKKALIDLNLLENRIQLLYDSIVFQDNGTGALHDLVQTVQSLRTTIENEITMAQRIAIEKEKFTNELVKNHQEFEAERRKWETDKKANQRKVNELEDMYREAKAKNDEGFFTKVSNAITWPFRSLFDWD
ncbi:GIMAP protein [Biomphalaria glabrata]|nr:GIMAP Resistant factor [Biomphalaria glabrata]